MRHRLSMPFRCPFTAFRRPFTACRRGVFSRRPEGEVTAQQLVLLSLPSAALKRDGASLSTRPTSCLFSPAHRPASVRAQKRGPFSTFRCFYGADRAIFRCLSSLMNAVATRPFTAFHRGEVQ